MAIYSDTFTPYEKLASSKLNELVASLNAHTHDGVYGVKLNFSNIDGDIDAVSQIGNGVITNDHMAPNSITTNEIVDGTILIGDINTSSVHLSEDGYAVYGP